ncbi:DMT family transporter [Roseococcus suduntuyensis]|uniref:Drug/metabolite transporter (DMT)-like permease n=1 Tax=Roseococcus suduntuyensis TaxID=455361 RepID=A0A840AC01_9PROT|nr:DMT family transporter [Roseococcus suduntuyensis]MBB3898056.1 drug/metabolite transporter (DMT)-like permease [Roseococcus suduntuyensis]
MTPDPSLALRAARRRAIMAILAAALLFAVAAAFVKTLGGTIPLAQLVLFRSLFALPVLLPMLPAAGGWKVLRTRHPFGHAARVFWGLLGMITAFYGYTTLPLANVTALGFTMPLFLTLLAVPLLGERVGWRRGLAVLVGFLGVLFMVSPGDTDAADLWPSLVVLFGAFAWAMAMISIRRLGEKGEPGVAIVLWFAIGCSILALAASIPVWVWPSATQWAFLLGIGIASAFAQLLMTEAYRKGEPTLVAPFEYSGIVWTTLLGAVIWAEAPDGWDAVGILILVGSGLYIWRREVQLGIKR